MMGRAASSSSTPVLSAVVVFGAQRGRAERCLRHLLAQTALDRMEIVIIDLAADAAPVKGTEQAVVRWCHRPDFHRFGQARAEGLRQSRGMFVAFLEDHTYADPRWAENVINAFARPVDLVNYAMSTANPERLLCRMFMMAEYGRWLDPARSGYVAISAANNVAYRRAALEPYWSRLDQLCEFEYTLHCDMQAKGSRVWLAADAKMAHETWTRFWDGVDANNNMKRLLAASRATSREWSAPTRAMWAAGMVLTPFLHIWRLAASLVRRPAHWPLFWTSMPLMLLLYACNAWAEATGYLFGEGNSGVRFRDLELSIPRKE
jgi:hypothetical protein